MDISGVIELAMPFIIFFIMIILVVSMFKRLVGNANINIPRFGMKTENVGERLKKYLLKASKSNPKNSQWLYLKQTDYSPGGRIGRISGILPTRYCTRFIFRNSRIGRMKLMYCPTNMHTTLQSKQVMVSGVGLDNAGGFYYPLPYDSEKNHHIFSLVKDAIHIDLKRMQVIDGIQLEIEQIMESITGKDYYDDFTTNAPEEYEIKQVPSTEEDYV